MLEIASSMRGPGLKAAIAVLAGVLALAEWVGSFDGHHGPHAVGLVPEAPVTFAEGADMIPIDAVELEPEGGG